MTSPRTLKTKLTLAYSLGVFASLAICFALVYGAQRHILLKSIRQKLDFFANEFQYEYLVASEYTNLHELVDPRKIPAACRQLIKQRAPGFETLSAVINPARRLEVVGLQNGEVVRIVFAADNSAIETAEPIGAVDRAKHMTSEFSDESFHEGQKQFFFLLLNPGGGLLARSPFSEEHLLDFMRLYDEAAEATAACKLRRRRDRDRDRAATASAAASAPAASSASASTPAAAAAAPTATSAAATVVIRIRGARMRVQRHDLYNGDHLLLGASLSDYDKNLNRLLLIFLCSLAVMPLVSLAVGRLLAGNVCAAVNRIAAAAREIESGDYGKRVRRGGEGREIDLLVDAFNDMTDRTERLLSELKNITGNIAHDLRTPLTRMRGKAELSLLTAASGAAPGYNPSADANSELAGVVAEECGDMLEIINTMLDIMQTENRLDAARASDVDMRALTARSLELFSTLAEDKRVTLAGDLSAGPVTLRGHASKLQRLLSNLLDNAIKFTPAGGAIRVSLTSAADAVTLEVSDTGCGMTEEELPRIFDRFYRSSASRAQPGNGLGLSLVRAITLAHGATIRVDSAPGQGAAFIISFPAPTQPSGKLDSKQRSQNP